MSDTIRDYIPRDADYPRRTRELDILRRVLDGNIYDVLPYRFDEERGPSGEYIPLRLRRPSVRYPLARIVVEDSVALLFGEGHFPTFDCANRNVQTALMDIAKESRLNLVMTEAAIKGSIGSVAILMRVLKGRVFFQPLDACYLRPYWSLDEPDALVRIVERYKVKGSQLSSLGYDILDISKEYWFMREWTPTEEVWYKPTELGSDAPSQVDYGRTTQHRLGFVPIVWIRNLPGGSSTGDPCDGLCTFRAAIETQIEIDYQLSQAGRGLKYSSDPTLLLKDPAVSDGEIVRSAGNALVVGEHGDARLLEIGGTATAAVIDYVRTLREFALESIHGNRASPERLTAAQSGRALELMNQGLLWLADNLRITYGEGALLDIASMVMRASQRYDLSARGSFIGRIDPTDSITLKWPKWNQASADDRQREAQTLATLAAAGHVSRATAVKSIADTYDIEDVDAELMMIETDRKSGSK